MSIWKSLSVILFTSVMLIACEKDKDDPVDNLIGTWTAESADVDATVSGKTMTQYFTDLGYSAADAQLLADLFNVTIERNFTGTITFNSDKTYTANLGGQTDAGTWDLSSDNKQLTIDSNTDPVVVFDVETLTAGELVVKWTETGQEDINDDNIPETINVNVTMELNK